MKTAKGYEISDFYLTAFLLTKGYKILDTRQNGKRTLFVLENKNGLEDEIKAFFNHEAEVEANSYKNNIQDLKSLLYSLNGR